MRIPPFCYIIDYFQRKSEERRNKLKKELLAELFPALDEKKEDLVKSARKELFSIADRFSDALGEKRKGLEAQVKELRDDVRKYEQKSRNAIESAREVKKNSERMQSVAQDAKKEADVVVDSMKTMEEIVRKAESFRAEMEYMLHKYSAGAVRQCTETVAAEMQKAVQEARNEYELNKEELPELVDRRNAARMTEWFAEFNKKSGEELQKFKADYAAAAESLQGIAQKVESVVADKQYVINALNFIRHNLPVVAYALQLSDLQKSLLRELLSDRYAGNLTKLREDLDEKSKAIQDKRTLSPEELETRFAKRDLNEMVRNVKTYNLGNLRNLLEAVDRLENVYKRPESSRQERH